MTMNPSLTILPESSARLRLAVRGAVQGVGFRPFVYRLANELGLTGWVNNSAQGVTIEIEGPRTALAQFQRRFPEEKPPRSFIQCCEVTWLDLAGYDGFVICTSETQGGKTALVMPDIATCPDCRREMFDPTNRRYRYPFTNCTHCGPRFSIIEALPYDRANTSMREFAMCPACQAEYNDPHDRRFHAQPNACPRCGPQLELWPGNVPAANGEPPRRLAAGNDALLAAAHVIRCGQIVAVKGIGGFHLFVDARNEAAVRRLRERKHREEKPFALLFPTLASVQRVCEVSSLEEQLLQSPEAPIVLLRQIANLGSQIGNAIAPGNPNLGVMLPSNPLHHLLMADLGFPVVATSGNLSDEPICIDELEALERLRGIADVLLVHNRPIVRHVDDSIVRVMAGRAMVLRRARGFAPLPITVAAGILPAVEPGFQPGGINEASLAVFGNFNVSPVVSIGPGGKMTSSTVLAVGAQLKNSIAFAVGDQVFLSQHLGDLETEPAHKAFGQAVDDLPRLYDAKPEVIAADLHPDYLSTRFALERQPPVPPLSISNERAGSETGTPQVIQVQHHVAHVLSCLAENEVELPALGVAWDGTGLGPDGTIWGGEFFLVTNEAVERVARWRPFRLPGGDAAAKEPRRAALGLLAGLPNNADKNVLHLQQKIVQSFSSNSLATLKIALTRGINAPWCCSVGRLFDAVAALIGLRQKLNFEGQAAMELEFAAESFATDAAYELGIVEGQSRNVIFHGKSEIVLDWAPMIEAILADLAQGVSVGEIAAKFHNTLVEAIISVAKRMGCQRVALSGGCFQNRYLLERAVRRLRAENFHPYWHQRVPTNDGGIALGQVVAARRSTVVCGSTSRSDPEPVIGPTKCCGWSDGHSRALLPRFTHPASR
jgi:hydrogenase maturation protein HypF